MKFLLLLSIFSASFLSFPYIAHAEVIQGNASSDVTVQNNVQGSGEVHTHIESTVNGQTKVLDSDNPGTYTLHNSSSSSSSSSIDSPPTSPNPTEKPTKPTQSPDPIRSVEDYFHLLIQKLLSVFRL